jgi:hypothetical protein
MCTPDPPDPPEPDPAPPPAPPAPEAPKAPKIEPKNKAGATEGSTKKSNDSREKLRVPNKKKKKKKRSQDTGLNIPTN